MSRLSITIASAAYDRVQALRDGTVRIEGCDHEFLTAGHEDLFLRGFHNAEYDVCELSMSSYLMSVAGGSSPYVAIPVFLSRLFRHSAIYLNSAAGIARPADLAGKRVGVPEYQITAALWSRGLLEDEYGVPPSALKWFQGGLHQPGRKEKLELSLPSSICIQSIGPDATLDELLRIGEIDALISARAPRGFVEGDPRIVRLFPEYRKEERAYFERTGVFPIMHVVAIRRTLIDAHPWLPNVVFDAFTRAKDLAVAAFSDVSALRVTLPWFAAELEETRAMMGDDFWPYGIDANRKTLSLLLEYAKRHGTVDRLLSFEEIFAPSTLVDRII